MSFVNAMEGAAERETKAYELMIAGAWHTEAFAREKRLKKLSAYTGKQKAEKVPPWAQAHAFFSGLQAKGLDIKIERVVH